MPPMFGRTAPFYLDGISNENSCTAPEYNASIHKVDNKIDIVSGVIRLLTEIMV